MRKDHNTFCNNIFSDSDVPCRQRQTPIEECGQREDHFKRGSQFSIMRFTKRGGEGNLHSLKGKSGTN